MAVKNSIAIDQQKIMSFIKSNGMSKESFSLKIGRSHGYIHNVMKAGKMDATAYNFMISVFGLDDSAFKFEPKPEPKLETKPEIVPGYSVSCDVYQNKVCFNVFFDGKEIYHAWSKTKGNTETDLMQAISYAAHMVYKMAEQADLEK